MKNLKKMTYDKKKCVFNKKKHFELLYITLCSFGIKHFLVKICKINKKCWCTEEILCETQSVQDIVIVVLW